MAKSVLFLFALILAINAKSIRKRSLMEEFKMCVPEDLMKYCEEMSKQETKSTAKIICVSARDRIECIEKIKEREADFGTVDPEDMYLAGKVPNNDFTIFEEIRTREEPDAEYRYEGVALIHKDLEISSPKDLKGLKSCHTGVGRNVGYKIPITKLKNMGIIGNLNDPSISPRENELAALSKLFSKACIVGDWSPDANINAKLKKKYTNLCSLCEKPDTCNYPDNYSGYEGAIRCLVHNGGDVAWTKVIFVRKFFGLPVGVTPAHQTTDNPENYAYFCPDGSKVPITQEPCRWAARPWQGFMANGAVVKNIDELRKKIENLNSEGYKNHAEWLEKILEITDKNIARENKVISPKDYLDKANYTDVIEREYGPPYKTLRFCVKCKGELNKCRAFSDAAFSRNIRPRIDCVLEENCLKAIQDNGADVITIPASELKEATNTYNLKPIVTETYGEDNFAVAIVKKNSNYQSFTDLKGTKSCHTNHPIAGYHAPLKALIDLKLLTKPSNCLASTAFAEFFSGGCLPNAKDYKLEGDAKEKMCSLCQGDKCQLTNTNIGALECLEKKGDVAFVESIVINKLTDDDKSKYELLCIDGTRAQLTEFKKCNLLHSVIPPHMVVTSNSKSNEEIEDIQSTLLSAGELYFERPDWFKLFGTFKDRDNLLFSNSAKSLETVKLDYKQDEIEKMLSAQEEFCK